MHVLSHLDGVAMSSCGQCSSTHQISHNAENSKGQPNKYTAEIISCEVTFENNGRMRTISGR